MPIVYHRSVVPKPGCAWVDTSITIGFWTQTQTFRMRIFGDAWWTMESEFLRASPLILMCSQIWKQLVWIFRKICSCTVYPQFLQRKFFSDWIVTGYFVCVSRDGKWRKYSVKGFCVFCKRLINNIVQYVTQCCLPKIPYNKFLVILFL